VLDRSRGRRTDCPVPGPMRQLTQTSAPGRLLASAALGRDPGARGSGTGAESRRTQHWFFIGRRHSAWPACHPTPRLARTRRAAARHQLPPGDPPGHRCPRQYRERRILHRQQPERHHHRRVSDGLREGRVVRRPRDRGLRAAVARPGTRHGTWRWSRVGSRPDVIPLLDADQPHEEPHEEEER
jgi:hypothetical protein